MSTKRTIPEGGVFFLGDPIKEIGNKSWFHEVELEPLDESRGAPNFIVKIGSHVLVANDEFEHHFLLRVTELYIDNSRLTSRARFKGRWYYRIEDTLLMVASEQEKMELQLDKEIGRRDGLDERRVWLAEEDDSNAYITDNPIGSIVELTNVKQINPRDPVPDSSVCDFWFNQTHSRKFYTFRDLFKKPKMEKLREPIRKLDVLDLFSGCGGLSFLDQRGMGCEIRTVHAVDMDADALKTYETNHPDVMTHCQSVEEFLFLCKHFDRLAGELDVPRESRPSPSKRQRLQESINVIEILSVELKHSVAKMKNGQGEGQLEKELTMENTSLRFRCKQKNGKEVVLTEADVKQNERSLRSFVGTCRLPRPGDIQVIVGGPPCQGVSGLNRHAQQTDVLNCRRNRLVKSFFRTIEFLKPQYALMENVLDIMKKQDGAYAKYATAQLLALGYQSRLGVIAAGSHGAAQHRWRCFLWGAQSGEVMLPPFPQPAFRLVTRTPIANNAKSCEVGFLTDKDKEEAYPPVLNEDILTDLPEVSNFCLSDAATYKSEPLRPMQAWLRRSPDENELDLQGRADRADNFMAATRILIADTIEAKKREASVRKREISVTVASIVLCQLGSDRKNDFASQIREVYLAEIEEEEDAAEQRKALDERKQAMLREHGSKLLSEFERIGDVSNDDGNLVRDHRPRLCNSDDYYRITSVPKGPGKNFRDMPGVVVNTEDQTVCAGHTHAFIGYGCRGGGMTEKPLRSTNKESRIDHADRLGKRVLRLKGCAAKTFFTPTLNLTCPRWCITYKNGLSNGRHGCFGRVRLNSVQPTVVTRAEPHNLEICHPFQDRVLTIREMARCQGFPDYYVFVGTEKEGMKKRSLARLRGLENRYKQIGNAVSPPVAAALGRCLLLAASGRLETLDPVVRTNNEDMVEALSEAKERGLKFYAEEIKEIPFAEGEISDEESDFDDLVKETGN